MSRPLANQKYTRSSIACENCRNRKARCDSASPSCGQCVRRGEICIYAPSKRERTSDTRFAAMHHRFDSLEVRFEHLDAFLRRFISPDNTINVESEDARINEFSRGNGSQQELLRQSHEHFRGHLLFNDRLAHMKAHVVGGQENTSVYMSSVFLSILSPEDIALLSDRLCDPLLTQNLEARSHRVWQEMQTICLRMFNETVEFKPDLSFLEASISTYSNLQDVFLHLLLPVEEIGFALKPTIPESLKNGQFAALLLMACIDIKLRNDFSVFSKESIEKHERAAIHQSIRSLNFMRFSRPGFMEVRLSILLVFLLWNFAAVPSIISFLDPVIDMSRAIGLGDSKDKTLYPAREAEWRENVWHIVCRITYNQKIMLSQKAPQLQSGMNIMSKRHMENSILPLEQRLHEMYNRAYEITFYSQNQGHSATDIFNSIIRLDSELFEWRKNIHNEYWNSELDSKTGILGLMKFLSVATLRLKYYYIILAVYSIPAFFPELLPEKIPKSLEKVTMAARALCESGVCAQQNTRECNLIVGTAVTTAACALLYKQLRYSNDASNRDDLRLLSASISSIQHAEGVCAGKSAPSVEIWEALIELMSRHYELCSVTSNESWKADDESSLPPEFFQNGQDCIII